LSPAQLRQQLEPHRERFEALLRTGQPPGWAADQRTLDVWCLGHFLDERFSGLPDERRRQLGHAFHRMVRSAEDPWQVAAEVLLVGDEGLELSDFSQRYWTARNHGKWEKG
jgi:hypothetical protein